VTEQAMLDLVPFRRAGRIMANADGQSGFVGELLQFDFPQAHARTVGAAAVRRDHEPIACRAIATEAAIVGVDPQPSIQSCSGCRLTPSNSIRRAQIARARVRVQNLRRNWFEPI
jgi:hypothetical protein